MIILAFATLFSLAIERVWLKGEPARFRAARNDRYHANR